MQTLQLRKLKFREAKELAEATQLVGGRIKVSPSISACCFPSTHVLPTATEHAHARVKARSTADPGFTGPKAYTNVATLFKENKIQNSIHK